MVDARSTTRTQDALAVVAVVAALLAFVTGALQPHTGELSHGFAAYYTSAQLVASGEDPSQFYDNRWFIERTIDAGFRETPDIYNVNPPTTALLFLPIEWLLPADADVVWTVVNGIFLGASVLALLQTLVKAGLFGWRRDRTIFGLLAALVLVFNPVHENFRYGQAYLLMLLMTSLAMLAYVRNRDRETGVWLGLMLLAKSSGTLLWVVSVLDRRIRTLVWGLVTVAAGIVATLPVLGIRVWWEYVQWLPSLMNQRWTGVTAYQTTASLIHHLTKVEASVSPEPLIDAGWLAGPLTTLTSIVILGAAALVGWRWACGLPEGQLRLTRFALISGLAVPLQPLGEEHHYVLLLPAVFVALAMASGTGAGLLAVVGAALLAAPLPFKDDAVRDGWLALLAYPKLYGAMLVAGSLAVTMTGDRMRAQRQSSSGRASLS